MTIEHAIGQRLRLGVALLSAATFACAESGQLSPAWGPDMVTPRMSTVPLSLTDGRVALLGGRGNDFVSLPSAEILNAEGTGFSLVDMPFPADATTVARMADGKYLVAGASKDLGIPYYGEAAVFDPATLKFTATGSLTRFRASAGAAALKSGKVLFAGAWWTHNDAHTYGDLYDPATGSFTATGGLNVPRARPLVFPTDDGQAVVVGGVGATGDALEALPELYHPDQNNFTPMGQLFAGDPGWRTDGLATVSDSLRLPDGRFIFMAYRLDGATTTYTLATFDPAAKTFAKFEPANPVAFGANPTFQPLVDKARNLVLVPSAANTAEGSTDFSVARIDLATRKAETFTGRLTEVGYKVSFDSTGAALLSDGRVLLAGGNNGSSYFVSYARTIVLTRPALGPKLGVGWYAGLTLEGKVGTVYEVQAAASPDSSQWTTVTNLTLSQSPYLWFDLSSPSAPKRFYRAVEAR